MVSSIDEGVSRINSLRVPKYEANNVEPRALNQSAGASQASLHIFIRAACL